MKINFKKIILPFLLLSASQVAVADDDDQADLQKYNDTATQLISQLSTCAVLTDQFSQKTHDCIIKANSNILSETAKTITKNKSYYAQYESGNPSIFNADSEIKKLNQDCLTTFPQSLRFHFKNQISYCQAQVNLNRYFFFNDIYFD